MVVLLMSMEISSMTKPKVYIETSTISFLTARPSEKPIIRAKQLLTQQWWACIDQFEPYVSDSVENEIKRGDPFAAQLRAEAISDIPRLHFNETVERLAVAILRVGAIPERVDEDAYHIAFAAAYGMDFLVTWNQKHIATPAKQFLIREVILSCGCHFPQLLTPENHLLMMDEDLLLGDELT